LVRTAISRDWSHDARVKTISKGKLKGRMLEYFRQVELMKPLPIEEWAVLSDDDRNPCELILT
jgi:hypothetical protein